MMVVCKDRLERIRANDHLGFEAAAAVADEVTALLVGKTYDQLTALQRRIQDKLTSGEPIDTDYWENLLQKLLVWKAKVYLHISQYLLYRLAPSRPNSKTAMKSSSAIASNS